MFSNFSYELKKMLREAKQQMKMFKHTYVGTEHFILAVLKSKSKLKITFNSYGITYESFKKEVINRIGYGNEEELLFVFTPLFKKILEQSIILVNETKQNALNTDTIIKSIFEEAEGVAYRILCEMGIDIDSLYEEINASSKKIDTPSLNEMGIDLTQKARDGLIDPVVGRKKEIEKAISILLRKNKRNPLLIGAAGVGKTAIAEALAMQIINEKVPKRLLNKRIISLSISSLVAGTKYRGEFEEKLLGILNEIEKSNNCILFIDEIHTLMGAGGAEGAVDASNILKPALSRDKITIIGATTIEEYKKYIERDKAFSRRFQKILISEPRSNDLFNILKRVKGVYEKHHNVQINNRILKYIIFVSKKYIADRKEPDKSIDILDEVSSMVSTRPSSFELRNNRFVERLKEVRKKKNELINNNNFKDAIGYREKERKIESSINSTYLKSNKEDIKKITRDDINSYMCSRYNIVMSDCKSTKSAFIKQKKELKINFDIYSKEIREVLKAIEPLFKIKYERENPISLLFEGNDNYTKNKIINKIDNIFFNNRIINIDLNEYNDEQSIYRFVGSSNEYNNNQSIFECIKEHPFYLIIFNNYNKSGNKTKTFIKEMLNKGYFYNSSKEKINILNSLIIFNDSNDISNPIGFNNKKKCTKSDLFKNVTKVINFNKIKASVI